MDSFEQVNKNDRMDTLSSCGFETIDDPEPTGGLMVQNLPTHRKLLEEDPIPEAEVEEEAEEISEVKTLGDLVIALGAKLVRNGKYEMTVSLTQAKKTRICTILKPDLAESMQRMVEEEGISISKLETCQNTVVPE